MLQASRLSCSCHEATVSVPPALGVEVVVLAVGAHAPRTTVPAVATTSRRNQRGQVPVIDPPILGAFYERAVERVNETTAFLRFANKMKSIHPPVCRVPEGGIRRRVGQQIVHMGARDYDEHPFEERQFIAKLRVSAFESRVGFGPLDHDKRAAPAIEITIEIGIAEATE